jgi:phosphopantothenoylcysteine decarboxylase/phosphopantothenate--cysteine ligase
MAASPTRVRRGARRLRIVVTAGPTREYLDSVRFISNASSGRMGFALARAAVQAGHDVTLICGPVSLTAPNHVRLVRVVTAEQMYLATRRAFVRADAAVFCAAVSDYRPARPLTRKAEKVRMARRIVLTPTVDIAASIGRIKRGRVMIGFALEDHDGRSKARRKLLAKRFDAIVLNSPANIDARDASAEVLEKGDRWVSWPRQSKAAMARRIIRLLERLDARRKTE